LTKKPKRLVDHEFFPQRRTDAHGDAADHWLHTALALAKPKAERAAWTRPDGASRRGLGYEKISSVQRDIT
jgi:hypothetical protein